MWSVLFVFEQHPFSSNCVSVCVWFVNINDRFCVRVRTHTRRRARPIVYRVICIQICAQYRNCMLKPSQAFIRNVWYFCCSCFVFFSILFYVVLFVCLPKFCMAEKKNKSPISARDITNTAHKYLCDSIRFSLNSSKIEIYK